MSFTLKIAETEEEKWGAYRVRYECLTLELGDDRYANHVDKTYIDKMDHTDSPITLIAIDNDTGQVVSTARINFRKDILFTADDIYPYQKLAETLSREIEDIKYNVVVIERGGTLTDYRGSIIPPLWGRLYYMAENIINLTLKNGIIIGFVETNNLKSMRMFTRFFGWSFLDGETEYWGNKYILGYKLLPDQNEFYTQNSRN